MDLGISLGLLTLAFSAIHYTSSLGDDAGADRKTLWNAPMPTITKVYCICERAFLTTMNSDLIVLMLGSAPDALRAADWPKPAAFKIVSINNAWRIRDDWDFHIYPDDFPVENRPERTNGEQQSIDSTRFVPANNQFGGIVYAGGTMAYTAGYWALSALKPRVLAFLGCDMIYTGEETHFYGQGEPDPLRDDVTLASLEAKSARLMTIAARQHCACVNLSEHPESRLLFPRISHDALVPDIAIPGYDAGSASKALRLEQEAGYFVEDGLYWQADTFFDPDVLAKIDKQWISAVEEPMTTEPVAE